MLHRRRRFFLDFVRLNWPITLWKSAFAKGESEEKISGIEKSPGGLRPGPPCKFALGFYSSLIVVRMTETLDRMFLASKVFHLRLLKCEYSPQSGLERRGRKLPPIPQHLRAHRFIAPYQWHNVTNDNTAHIDWWKSGRRENQILRKRWARRSRASLRFLGIVRWPLFLWILSYVAFRCYVNYGCEKHCLRKNSLNSRTHLTHALWGFWEKFT